MISSDQIGELEVLYEESRMRADAFSEAAKALAELHQMDPVALKQFVAAKVKDKLDKLERRQATLAQLALFDSGAP